MAQTQLSWRGQERERAGEVLVGEEWQRCEVHIYRNVWTEVSVGKVNEGALADGKSALMLVCARFRCMSGGNWANRRYLDMNRLLDLEKDQQQAA